MNPRDALERCWELVENAERITSPLFVEDTAADAQQLRSNPWCRPRPPLQPFDRCLTIAPRQQLCAAWRSQRPNRMNSEPVGDYLRQYSSGGEN